jgi:hypothetical protein
MLLFAREVFSIEHGASANINKVCRRGRADPEGLFDRGQVRFNFRYVMLKLCHCLMVYSLSCKSFVVILAS